LTGYCLQFQIYTGKSVEHGLAYRVVFDLLKEYLDKGYYVYFDNFYTSLKLLQDLALHKTFACGTIRVDRGDFPEQYKYAKLEKGDSKFIKNDDILAVHWKDKRDVFAMSSMHGNGTELVERRGENNNITKPSMILEYDKYMNRVDKCDQYLTYYSLRRKARKWWKKVFFRLCELCIINAMVLYFAVYPDFAKQRQAHKLFRIQLALSQNWQLVTLDIQLTCFSYDTNNRTF
jgi:hypothetical protein